MTPRPPARLASALLAGVLLVSGCAYSFSGASLPPELRTVAVPLAENRAVGGPPTLEQTLTDALVVRFADRSRLSLVADEGAADLVVRAVLERYAVAPAAVTSDNLAALNRVSVSVRIVVTERASGRERLARAFQASEDTSPGEGLQGEAEAAARALAQVAQDAFTAATSEW